MLGRWLLWCLGHVYPVHLDSFLGIVLTGIWTIILLGYACIASILPVQTLLQPRDFLNAWQLFIALGLLVLGAIAAGVSGQLIMVAPSVVVALEGAPSMMPFLFITIACGAISGFHSLVASGTTSAQLNRETDAVGVGYGSMLIEGALAVMVIVAYAVLPGYPTDDGGVLTGVTAWNSHYFSWGASAGLASKIQAVVGIGLCQYDDCYWGASIVGDRDYGCIYCVVCGDYLDTSTGCNAI